MEMVIQNQILNEMKIKSCLNFRKIILDGVITTDNILETLYLLDKLVDLDNKTGTREPITIFIHSYGGSVLDGNLLICRIKELQEIYGYKIIGLVGGYAMSQGFQILQACSVRKCYKYSRLMFHCISTGVWSDLEDIERDIEETKYLMEIAKDIVKERTLITDEMMDKWKVERRDKYFNNEELLKYKIVDEIIGDELCVK